MAKMHATIAGALIALSCPLPGQQLDDAEVRIPYRELKQLLARAEPEAKPQTPEPALLSARLRVSVENDRAIVAGRFRTLAFGETPGLVPLLGGDVSLEQQEPADAAVILEDKRLCLVTDQAGSRALDLRLLPMTKEDGFSIDVPACPSVILETGELPAERALAVRWERHEEILGPGRLLPLPNTGVTVTLRILDQRETREALLPPEPSQWTWQHEALVIPASGELIYQVIASATASDGSGVEAQLPMPRDAREITIQGEDLATHRIVRGANRSLALAITWKTRGILDRRLEISYRMPLRPLDREWLLQAPGDADTRTRFLIGSSPVLSYAADGLSEPLDPSGLPAVLAKALDGMNYHHLEAATTASLTATPIPLAATEQGVIKQAEWALKVEPDGSMLATGILLIEHKGPLGFILDTPPDMKLLTCELAGKALAPTDLGGGKIKVALPASGDTSRLTCAFTRAAGALDPVEGTLALTLPRTPLFIHALKWVIDLPEGYQAETHGNLIRLPSPGGQSSRILLAKNLCRDERPEVRVFYQRADLNR